MSLIAKGDGHGAWGWGWKCSELPDPGAIEAVSHVQGQQNSQFLGRCCNKLCISEFCTYQCLISPASSVIKVALSPFGKRQVRNKPPGLVLQHDAGVQNERKKTPRKVSTSDSSLASCTRSSLLMQTSDVNTAQTTRGLSGEITHFIRQHLLQPFTIAFPHLNHTFT